MVNSALLIKTIGGGVVATSATGVGIYYKNDIWKYIKGIGEEESNILVKTSSTVTAPSDEELYKTETGSNKKTKNYTCQISDKSYQCEIVKEITVDGTKKWTKAEIDKAPTTALANEAKTNLAATDKYFVIKASDEMTKAITWTDAQEIQIVDATTKKKDFF